MIGILMNGAQGCYSSWIFFLFQIVFFVIDFLKVQLAFDGILMEGNSIYNRQNFVVSKFFNFVDSNS